MASASCAFTAASTYKTKTEREGEAAGFYNQGIDYVNEGNFKRAVNLFRRAIASKRDFHEAYNMLGFSLRKIGKYEQSLKYYKKALELKPDFAEAHEYIGESYLGIGDRESAWKHYTILVGLDKEQADVLLEKIEEYVNSL
jgi:tetratricopeptide (TPR) repeat protein